MQYNLLTLQLLYEGYTTESYPDYVQIDSSRFPGNNPLRNLGGGFIYNRSYLNEMVFKTPCGYHVRGSKVFGNMSYLMEWMPENNNPVIKCPFALGKDFSCDKVHPLLRENIGHSPRCRMQFCSCRMTEESYDYEKSIEKVWADRDSRIATKYQEFVAQKNGRVCRNHAHFNEFTDEWEMNYSPERCAVSCYSTFCPIRGRVLEKKKANVYYDVYKKGVYEEGLIRQEWERVDKGIRFFEKPVSKDICEAFVKLESDMIYRMYRLNNGRMSLLDPTLVVEIRNIRVESRARRDLEQDLIDIREGRFVSWAPEEEKKRKEEKKLRREQAKEKRKCRMEKKIIKSGFAGLDAADRRRAEKLLSVDRLDELELLHKEEKEKAELVQVSLMDYILE